uniref:Myb-like domain-containing protein n=1 Tax=Bionectria ochroleuca TaxID=29856 RepID=A0A8H7TS94_BIOOC
MPGAEKKWGPLEERDLAMAVILTQHGERPKYDWVRIQEMMEAWGYTFSRDAITQRWSKKIMKDFKERHGADAAKSGPSVSAASTPQKPKVVKDEDDSDSEKKVKPVSAKKRKLAKESDDDSDRETQKAAPGDVDFDSGV